MNFKSKGLVAEWKLAARKKKVFENFCTTRIVLSKWPCCCVRKMSSTRYKIQIYKVNNKLTMGSCNFDVIKELKRNFSGSHEVPLILKSKEDDDSTKKQSGICSQMVSGIGSTCLLKSHRDYHPFCGDESVASQITVVFLEFVWFQRWMYVLILWPWISGKKIPVQLIVMTLIIF